MRKIIVRTLPYLAAILTGCIFFILAQKFEEVYYDLMINIAAAFFAIPLLFLFYETARNFSRKKLTKEIFDYAKMQIDREILSITNQLSKVLYSYKDHELSEQKVSSLISTTESQIKIILEGNTYLGFQIFKQWEFSEKGLQSVLQNPFILERLEDDQTISIIELLKSLRLMETVQTNPKLYIPTKNKSDSFKIQKGTEISAQNEHLPNRYLLLESIGNDKFVIRDFGDIPQYKVSDCLNLYVINPKHLRMYAAAIYGLSQKIDSWLKLTGDEFLIDTKMFRFTTIPST